MACYSIRLPMLPPPLVDKGSHDRGKAREGNDSAKQRPPLKRGIGTRREGGKNDEEGEGQSKNGLQFVELQHQGLDMLAVPRLLLCHGDDAIGGTGHNVLVSLQDGGMRERAGKEHLLGGYDLAVFAVFALNAVLPISVLLHKKRGPL